MDGSRCGANPNTGKEMGYGVEGMCSEKDCQLIITHGISSVCGGEHLGGVDGCGDYFCGNHLFFPGQLCGSCFHSKMQRLQEVKTDLLQQLVTIYEAPFGLLNPIDVVAVEPEPIGEMKIEEDV